MFKRAWFDEAKCAAGRFFHVPDVAALRSPERTPRASVRSDLGHFQIPWNQKRLPWEGAGRQAGGRAIQGRRRGFIGVTVPVNAAPRRPSLARMRTTQPELKRAINSRVVSECEACGVPHVYGAELLLHVIK